MHLDGQDQSQLGQQADELGQENALLVAKSGTVDVLGRQILAGKSRGHKQRKDPRKALKMLCNLPASQAGDRPNLCAGGPCVAHDALGWLVNFARQVRGHVHARRLQGHPGSANAVEACQQSDLVICTRHSSGKPLLHSLFSETSHASRRACGTS